MLKDDDEDDNDCSEASKHRPRFRTLSNMEKKSDQTNLLPYRTPLLPSPRICLCLSLYAAIAWLPIYGAVEFIFHYANPLDPPHSIMNFLQVLGTVIFTTALLFNAILALVLGGVVPLLVPGTRNTLTLSHVWRIFSFLMLRTLMVALLLGGTLFAVAFTARPKAIVNGTVLLALLLLLLNVTSLTTPALLLTTTTEHNHYSLWQALYHSLQLTTHSRRALVLPALTWLAFQAAWMVPLAVLWWPPPLAVLGITWMATAGNWMLWFSRLYPHMEHDWKLRSSQQSSSSRRSRMFLILALAALVWVGDLMVHHTVRTTTTTMEPSRVSFQEIDQTTKPVWYSRTRFDRSGSQILEMFLHHAYAHHHGALYGGACQIGPATLVQNKTKQVIEAGPIPGLHDVLQYGCPPRGRDDPALVMALYPWILGDRIVTEDFLEFLQSHVVYPEKDPDVFTIAVHIRRGDISPCIGVNLHRYLPNSYYIDMIDYYLQEEAKKPEHRHKKVQVVVHSVHNSFETFAAFERRNYTVLLSTGSGTLGSIWMDLILADVFIMSPSSFSVVPALLKRDGIAVYAPFPFFTKLPRWEGLDWPELEPYKQEVLDFKPLCDVQNKTREYPHGASGVWYLLHNFTGQGILSFLVPS